MTKSFNKLNTIISKIDKMPLWLLGLFLELIVFIPYFFMGGQSVFPWHDQLDEDILNYVIPAKHIFEGLSVYPEMMNGVTASALQPFALLFVPLYIFFPARIAFTVQYAIVFAIAFYGMYFCCRECTESSIISLCTASFFSLLPFMPVYGASVAGIPLILYAIICLEKKKNTFVSFICIAVFALTAHVVFSGYAVLLFWGTYIVISFIRKKTNVRSIIGCCFLTLLYALINYQLFLDIFLHADNFESHRSEFVITGTPFFQSLKSVLFSNLMHAASNHIYTILPIILLILFGVIFKKKLKNPKGLATALIGLSMIILIAFLFSFLKSETFASFRNSQNNVFRYFQFDRFYWLLPALWWLELGLSLGIFWNAEPIKSRKRYLGFLFVIIAFIPSFMYVRDESYFYMSVNQINNGSNITGYITWDGYYSDDVMTDIENAIGSDMSTYRIAHIGMCPAPSLMHGFYTIDGYSNSYSLEYKHTFRKAMEKELAKSPATAVYYDTWGNRCYLFNSQSGNSFMNGKSSNIKYSNLEYDYDLLKQMGCRYLFSCGEIVDYYENDLKFIGEFTSDTSYWDIWVYEL